VNVFGDGGYLTHYKVKQRCDSRCMCSAVYID